MKLSNTVLIRTIAALTLTAISAVSTSTQAAPGNRLGYNTSGLHHLGSSNPFIDIFKISRGWITSCEYNWQENRAIDPGCEKGNSFNTKESDKVKVDKNGWPMRLPARGEAPVYTSINAIWDMPANFPVGRHFVTYTGDADIKVHGDVEIIRQIPGRIDFNLRTAKRKLRLHITRINPRNYIRNIKVIPQRFANVYPRQTFNPEYLKTARNFNSIRFMPWQNTKLTTVSDWSERATPQHAFYNHNGGIPAETMIDMANQAQADPWFSMPHLANDTYYYRFAQTVKARLHPSRKVYIENSNEIWNSIYPATHDATRKALQLWPRGKLDIKNAGARRLFLALNYNAHRSRSMCRLFKRVLGNRAVCVVSAYGSAPKMAEELMTCPLAGGNCYKDFDAYAVAPYFGDYIARIENRSLVKRWAAQGNNGMNQLFREIMHGGLAQNAYQGGAIENAIQDRVVKNIAVAKKYGLQLLAYEGGQHLLRVDRPHVINDPKIFRMFANANRHPQMGVAYKKYLNAWHHAGGGMLMHFNGIAAIDDRNYFPMLEKAGTRSAKLNAMTNYIRGR